MEEKQKTAGELRRESLCYRQKMVMTACPKRLRRP